MPIASEAQATSAAPLSAEPRKWRWWHRNRWAFLLLAVLAILGAAQLWNHFSDSVDREPLQVAQRAAAVSGTSIGVISPGTEDRWSEGDGPRESQIKKVVASGNEFLKPIYLAWTGSDRAKRAGVDRCYYVAVQPGSKFDAERVRGIAEFCYQDPMKTPYDGGYTSVGRR